jgi:hypothetical protein
MDHDYEGYWQGIAVHNGDPMVDPDYDNGMAPYIGGYPSGLVDRGPDIDPSDFKQDFLQRIVIPPSGIITNGAELNGNVLNVSLTVEFQTAVSGNYKLACVIVEDSVTGTTPDYYQANAYSGGGAGPLVDVDGTDWANMPSNVPASQMVYRHVARGIAPSFAGDPLPLTAYNIGAQEFITLTFILDPSWDQSQISIVGMLFDDQGNIDNASSSKLYDAINNVTSCTPSWDCINGACVDPGTGQGIYASLTACQGNCLITSVYAQGIESLMIYPNPADKIVNIQFSTIVKQSIKIRLISTLGEIIFIENLQNYSGDYSKKINLEGYSKGIYFIKIISEKGIGVKKIIIE